MAASVGAVSHDLSHVHSHLPRNMDRSLSFTSGDAQFQDHVTLVVLHMPLPGSWPGRHISILVSGAIWFDAA